MELGVRLVNADVAAAFTLPVSVPPACLLPTPIGDGAGNVGPAVFLEGHVAGVVYRSAILHRAYSLVVVLVKALAGITKRNAVLDHVDSGASHVAAELEAANLVGAARNVDAVLACRGG